MARRLPAPQPDPGTAPDGPLFLPWLLGRLVRIGPAGVDLLAGFEPAWAGQGVAVYDAVVGSVRIGFAVRWHGERPAVLWEMDPPATLSASGLDPAWRAPAASRGDALLAALNPRGAR